MCICRQSVCPYTSNTNRDCSKANADCTRIAQNLLSTEISNKISPLKGNVTSSTPKFSAVQARQLLQSWVGFLGLVGCCCGCFFLVERKLCTFLDNAKFSFSFGKRCGWLACTSPPGQPGPCPWNAGWPPAAPTRSMELHSSPPDQRFESKPRTIGCGLRERKKHSKHVPFSADDEQAPLSWHVYHCAPHLGKVWLCLFLRIIAFYNCTAVKSEPG